MKEWPAVDKVKDGWARENGIEVGDKIMKINGKDTCEISVGHLKQQMQQRPLLLEICTPETLSARSGLSDTKSEFEVDRLKNPSSGKLILTPKDTNSTLADFRFSTVEETVPEDSMLDRFTDMLSCVCVCRGATEN
mmetsp:Transcript_110170/g.174112  ORF Transcript_110170/g.174112 Transcript_110170/m.174112 type:complete len:136 (+) Transcript_110170:2-409(+)